MPKGVLVSDFWSSVLQFLTANRCNLPKFITSTKSRRGLFITFCQISPTGIFLKDWTGFCELTVFGDEMGDGTIDEMRWDEIVWDETWTGLSWAKDSEKRRPLVPQTKNKLERSKAAARCRFVSRAIENGGAPHVGRTRKGGERQHLSLPSRSTTFLPWKNGALSGIF